MIYVIDERAIPKGVALFVCNHIEYYAVTLDKI